jgi:hypothetical protein
MIAPDLVVRRAPPVPSKVYDTLWRFACERQAIFHRRLAGRQAPWTDDPILKVHRFTNAYRASDRVSQYLIRNVIYRSDLPSAPREVIFRVLLFKLFNRIDTWNRLDSAFGPLTAAGFRFALFANELDRVRREGQRLYSAAYIMPSTGPLGESAKHRGHLRLLEKIISGGMDARVGRARSIEEIFRLLLAYPTLGPFLAFQFAIDLNYSEIVDFSEMDFVVAGPGAVDGLRKCFVSFGDYSAADVIRWVTDRQELDPERLGLGFPGLFGRPLQLIDTQNLFCEVSKYARVAHPDIRGSNGRNRIKQLYKVGLPAPHLFFPPKWGINESVPESARAIAASDLRQPLLVE